MKIKVGAVSPSCYGARFQVMQKYIEGKNLDLIVFPEEYFGTDFVTGEPTYIAKEDVVNNVSKLAKDNDVHIVTGFLEALKNGRFHNEALLFSPEGLVGTYIKTTPYVNELESLFPGSEVKVFETKIGKISMLICWEVWFPELARIATLKGAEIICFPTGQDISTTNDRAWLTLWQARAIENDVYVIACVNAKGAVTSMICGPEGTLAIGEREGIITAELNMDRLEEIREGTVKTQIEPALVRRRSPFLRKIGDKMLSC